ncbi:MAG: YicC family protein [Magnetococcales bacterium]|nr:YicC family protein [Magnetococcales bacterium]
MPNSMTGFAEEQGSHAGFRLIWRLRSVNHRYLDLSFRRPGHWPGRWHDLESEASKRLHARFARGHVECELHLLHDTETGGGPLELDAELLQTLLHLEREVRAQLGEGERGLLPLDRLLSWPGLIRERRPQEQQGPLLLQAALTLLESAMEQLEGSRAAEGRALTAVVKQLLDDLSGLLLRVEGLLPGLRSEQKRILQAKVAELTGTGVEPGELAREMAVLLSRVDVAEEVERLRIHIQELRLLLAGPEAVGRRLDFFCQELNREANTLCSKSQNSTLTRLGVEIKLVVEKLREQAQNLE